ncbi:MAG: hypothetical protein HOW73_46375 [Polyangiaceae bacterium]|nr:hypothetical protein [Polyangiaceae bacterium]
MQTLVAAAGILALAPLAEAAEEASKPAVTAIQHAPNGTTLTLRAKHAPYPHAGGAYDDPTVFVFVPASYRLPSSKRVDVVVHYHGHNTTAAKALGTHALREQLVESKQNAILVVPQGPVLAADGDFGKLMAKRGVARLLAEVLKLAAGAKASKELGDATLAKADGVGRVIASAHSGGYRAAAAAVQRGGVDLREVYLFDALYGEVATFADFASAGSDVKHKLVSYAVAGVPLANGAKLASILEARGLEPIVEKADRRVSREELVRGRALFLLGKATHATATYEERALRDCMLASCFVGSGTKAWHAKKHERR